MSNSNISVTNIRDILVLQHMYNCTKSQAITHKIRLCKRHGYKFVRNELEAYAIKLVGSGYNVYDISYKLWKEGVDIV